MLPKYLWITAILFICCTKRSHAQPNVIFLEAQPARQAQASASSNPATRMERTSINAGLLMGGGGLIGADLEFMVSNRTALQIGAGFGSVGGGICFHFKPQINSSFISIQYFHQGFGGNHYGSYLGPMYVFRAKKIFQAGIGFGTVLTEGPQSNLEGAPVILLYNIGVYFPL